MRVSRNTIAVITNSAQGDARRVLCVCSAGVLRSPTAAWILSNAPFNFNTRACGDNPDYALIPLTPELIAWADEIVCMEGYHAYTVNELIAKMIPGSDITWPPVHVLNIEDEYDFRQKELVDIMTTQLSNIFIGDNNG